MALRMRIAAKLMKRMPSQPAATRGSFCCAARSSSKLTRLPAIVPSSTALRTSATDFLSVFSHTSS